MKYEAIREYMDIPAQHTPQGREKRVSEEMSSSKESIPLCIPLRKTLLIVMM